MAVLFGFVLVVDPASGFEVVVLGGAAVGDRVYVVVFEVDVSPAAVGALASGEFGYGAEVEGGFEGGGEVAAEVFDGVDVGAVMQDGFEERVLAEFVGDVDGDGAAADDVAGFAGESVSSSPRVEVADDDQLGVK